MARSDTQWPLGRLQHQEATREGAQSQQGTPIRSLFIAAYVSDPSRRIRLRRLDARADRRTQFPTKTPCPPSDLTEIPGETTGKHVFVGLVLAVALGLSLVGCQDTKAREENEQLKAHVLQLQKDAGELGNRIGPSDDCRRAVEGAEVRHVIRAKKTFSVAS